MVARAAREKGKRRRNEMGGGEGKGRNDYGMRKGKIGGVCERVLVYI